MTLSNAFKVEIVDEPAWLSGVLAGQWVEIPGSRLTSSLDDSYFETIGLPRPTLRPTPDTNAVTFGANKYGNRALHLEGLSWGTGHYSYSGMAFDSRGTKCYVGGCDAHWAENSYHAFHAGASVPFWQPAVIASSHHLDFKHPSHETGAYPPTMAGDDERFERHYDGRPRAGHKYWSQHYIRAREWLAQFEQHQYWPHDAGYSQSVIVADVARGEWLITDPIAPTPVGQGVDLNPWQEKHHLSENVYYNADEYLYRWNQASNTYQAILHYDRAPYRGWGTSGINGAINWQEDWAFFEGWSGSASKVRARYVIDDLETSAPTYTDVTMVGPAVDLVSFGKVGCMRWCPDLGGMLAYCDWINTPILITRMDRTTFHAAIWPTTGSMPPAGVVSGNGGVVSNWAYAPELKGFVLRLSDVHPMYFLRTA
jgi:hypothetical protein